MRQFWKSLGEGGVCSSYFHPGMLFYLDIIPLLSAVSHHKYHCVNLSCGLGPVSPVFIFL